jgi:hypothetical protein
MLRAAQIATALLDNEPETARQFIHRTVGSWHGVAKAHGFSNALIGGRRYRNGMFQKSYPTLKATIYVTLIGSDNKSVMSLTVVMRDRRSERQMFLASWDINPKALDDVMDVFDVIVRSDNPPDVLMDMIKFMMDNHKK